MSAGFASVEQALDALRAGRPVLVLDDEDRENEGDVILAAQTLEASWLAWTIRHTSGYICAPMPNDLADRLDLPLMVAHNEDRLRTAYTITVDATEGVTTGISAADRTHTIRMLAESSSAASDFVRPGHVVPLRARDGGVLERRGHTEAAVDLARLAGLSPVGAIGELVHDDGTMMRTPDVLALGARHDLPTITIEALVRWRRRHDRVEQVVRTTVPTAHGAFAAVGYRDRLTGAEHVALVSPHGLGPAPVVRVHSECLTGDAFGSLRCDCGPQLDAALARIGSAPGVVVYLRGQEGRGVGLLDKLRAYAVQDAGYLPEGMDAPQERKIEALYRYLCDAPSLLLNVALVDAVGEKRIQNQPGTSDEYPNWRVPLADSDGRPVMLESLPRTERVNSLVDVVNEALGTHRRTPTGNAPRQPERRDPTDPLGQDS